MSKKQEYNADNINVLEGLSAIRKRPGMYIGDVGERGLHHCVYEVLDNSTDEAVAGYGKVIKLTKLKNGGIRVEDEGRGIPVEKKENGISAATITLTVLHAGGKFDKDTYKTSGGLHGIGIKATNATSKWLKLTICRNGEQWEQEFEKGVPLYEIKQVGLSKKTGTILEFIPDDLLFDNIIYDSELLKNRLRNSSFLTKNIEFIYIDEATKEKESFLSLNGLEDMISYQIDPDNILTPVMSFSGSDEKRGFLKDKDTGKEEENGILEKFDLEVSFLYEKGYKTTISSYVNKILTPGGGVHEQGVLDALSAGILKKVKEAKVISKKDKEIISKVNLDDVKEGLVLAISLSVYTDIIFEGQTKDKLSGVHLRSMIRNLSRDKIETYLNANPVITNKIVQKVITSRKARESAERARKTERKQQTEEIGSMLGKLTDCRSNNPEECELFIVEGQSAGGCVFSETLVKTPSGKEFTIKEIAEKHQNGEEVFVYTYNEHSKKIEIQKISNAWKTKTTSDLVKVFLDNGEEIICTPDHPFLLKTGIYVAAKNLKNNISLMSITNYVKENINLYNKVLKVEKLVDTLDVYDIEVPETHNFALSAGVFVHNSSKQGRDGRYQAILPLKGKPINPLKSGWADVIANDEILSLKTALGCGMGDNIDLSKLRYHKIINQTDADIDGCLRGNTKIKLLDGRIKTIKELAELYPIGGETFEVWSYDLEKNTPVIGIAHSVRITKKVNNLYKIIFEDDSFVECTANHPFLTTKGTYVFAEKLQKGDSIESLYFNLYKEYEYISSKSVKYTPTHRYVYSLVDEISNYVIHHKDENKQNNSMKNLEKLTKQEHSKIHSKTGKINLINYNYSDKHKDDIKNAIKKGKYKYNSFEKYNKSEVHKKEVSERNKESWKNEDYRNYMQLKLSEYLVNGGIEILSANTKKQWENKEISFKMQATRMVNVIKVCLNKYNCVDKDKYNLEKPKSGVPTWDNMLIKLDLKESELENFAKTYNHKIKSIEIISTNEEEVYDLSVEKYHNFGIIPDDKNKGIIFVHNSHIQQLLLTIYNTLFKPLLEAGYIYRAVPPLHRVKIGKEPFYLNTDKDKKEYILKTTEEETKKIKSSKKYKELFSLDKEKLDELDIRLKEIDKLLSLEYSDKLSIEKSNLLNLKNNFKSVIFLNSELKSALSKYVFNRFKGLGEMNPEQLSETTMNPKTRQLIQLKPDKLYDLSDVINTDDFGNNSLSNILSIVERRKEEKKLKKEKHPVKDSLVDLTIDNIIGLISSDKGKEFRKIYLMRNIIGSEIGD